MAWEPLNLEEERERGIFMLDANIDVSVVRNDLQGLGLRILELPTELRHHPAQRADPNVLRAAYQRNALLVTRDCDFLDTDEFPPDSNPGVIVIPGGSGDVGRYMFFIEHLLIHVAFSPSPFRCAYLDLHEDGTISVISEDPDIRELGLDRLRIDDGSGDIAVWLAEDE